MMSFEDFELSANIAAGCTTIITNHTENTCAFEFAGAKLFTNSISVCENRIIEGNNDYGSICYHVPVDVNKLFGS